MLRYIACLAVVLLAGASLRAGELDADYKPAAPSPPAVQQNAVLPVNAVARAALGADSRDGTLKASELDGETPAQSWRGCGWGGGWGCGWRGCGWGGCGWGGCGWGGGWGCGWRGCGWGGCGWGGCGWGGWGCYQPCFAYYPTCISVGFGGYPYGGYCW